MEFAPQGQATSVAAVVVPGDLPLQPVADNLAARTEIAVLEAARRRGIELVGPPVERMQGSQRRLQRLVAIAAKVLPAGAPPHPPGRARGFPPPGIHRKSVVSGKGV